MATTSTRVFISGISRGLGNGLARGALRRGWLVYALGRTMAEEFAGRPELRFVPADLARPETATLTLTRLLDGVEKLDLVILNAGVLGEFGDIRRVGLETMREVMEVNLWANKVILDTIFAGRRTVTQVIAISSGASLSGNRGWNGYGLSKAALNMLVKLYAAELPGCHFCALAPGVIDTGMQDYLCGLEPGDDYQTIARLRELRGTPAMPDAATAAEEILGAAERLRTSVASGGYVDIRE